MSDNRHFSLYYSQYGACDDRNLFAINYLKDRAATCEEFAAAWDRLDNATCKVSHYSSESSQHSRYSFPPQTYKQCELEAKRAAKARRYMRTYILGTPDAEHEEVHRPWASLCTSDLGVDGVQYCIPGN